jgi:undecaprenyl-diphosphatase
MMALALLAPVAAVLAYLSSELIKSLLRLPRPCWDITGIPIIASCPARGDWSLPSNHATFAAAATVALIFAWRRTAPGVLVLGLLGAFSRVFVGVHYPHDVAAGVLLGLAVVLVVVPVFVSPVTVLIGRLRERAALRVLP